MRITQFFGTNSRNANNMRYDFNYYKSNRNIYNAYSNPSSAKIKAWEDIRLDYSFNNGLHETVVRGKTIKLQYQNDVRVCGASSHFFSTISSWLDLETGQLYLIKETHCNTYMCEL